MPEFVGQFYVNTSASPKIIYVATSINPSTGWQRIENFKHTHEVKDVVDLEDRIIDLMDKNGIGLAIENLMSSANTWEGGMNNFLGELRVKNHHVLTEQHLKVPQVDPESNAVIGWTGSEWGPMELKTGVTVDPDGEGPDYTTWLNRSDVVNSLDIGGADVPLSAEQGTRLREMMENRFSEKGHTHTEYAPMEHEHDQYIHKDRNDNVMNSQLAFDDLGVFLYAQTEEGGRFTLSTGLSEDRPHSIEVDGNAGKQKSLYMGGMSGATAKELVLNFEEVRIPSGKLVTDAESGRIIFSPIRIESASGEPTQYVRNASSREYGIHMDNTSMIGINQMVFSKPSTSPSDAILFPKSHAGYAMSSEIGYYNYMYMLDDRLKTDAALDSEKKYIVLGGRKIFFTNTDPGRDAQPGDIWFRL